MTREDIVNATIDTYMNLQRIKKANGGHDNAELDYSDKGRDFQIVLNGGEC